MAMVAEYGRHVLYADPTSYTRLSGSIASLSGGQPPSTAGVSDQGLVDLVRAGKLSLSDALEIQVAFDESAAAESADDLIALEYAGPHLLILGSMIRSAAASSPTSSSIALGANNFSEPILQLVMDELGWSFGQAWYFSNVYHTAVQLDVAIHANSPTLICTVLLEAPMYDQQMERIPGVRLRADLANRSFAGLDPVKYRQDDGLVGFNIDSWADAAGVPVRGSRWNEVNHSIAEVKYFSPSNYGSLKTSFEKYFDYDKVDVGPGADEDCFNLPEEARKKNVLGVDVYYQQWLNAYPASAFKATAVTHEDLYGGIKYWIAKPKELKNEFASFAAFKARIASDGLWEKVAAKRYSNAVEDRINEMTVLWGASYVVTGADVAPILANLTQSMNHTIPQSTGVVPQTTSGWNNVVPIRVMSTAVTSNGLSGQQAVNTVSVMAARKAA